MLDLISTLPEVQKVYAWFQEMRDTQPVWLDESSGFWHVFRYNDVHTVTTDYTLFSSERKQGGQPYGSGRTLTRMDPPQHRQYRNLVSAAFTPRAISRLSGRIGSITHELLDAVRPTGHMDFVADFAYPLPTIVIAEMLGVPASDRPLFKRWADGLVNFQLSDAELFQSGGQQLNSVDLMRMQNIFGEMTSYFTTMLEDRRKQPRTDLMSDLLTAEVDGERLSMEDIVSFCILLLLAGHVTTTNLLSQAIHCLSEHPSTLARLREQPALIPEAIEEVLRYASPVWRLRRFTTRDVTLAGVTIPANSRVFAWLASANRDERQFPSPERFDITRTPNRHLTFGHGIHFCIGAPLSRLEASVALPILLERLPDFHVINDQPLELLEGYALFGFKRLPIAFATSTSTV